MSSVLRAITVRRVVAVVGLVMAWCALWGEVSWANVLSGLVVGCAAMLVGVGGTGRGGIRFGPLIRFGWLVTVDIVVSTFSVVREVVTPTDYTEEAVIAVPVPPGTKRHFLLLYGAITVTPGSAVVAAEEDGSVVYVHILHCDRRDSIEAHIVELADLANRALPTPVDERQDEGVVG